MDKIWNKTLPYRHISEPADEIISYMDSRRKKNIISLKTRWNKFNNQCMGGIEPNTIYTFASISGGGKSSFANSLESDLFELNPDTDFVILSFNFEMLSSKQVGRKLSYKMHKTTQELYSGTPDIQLNDEDFEWAIKEAKGIKKYRIYYVDIPGTIDDVRNTIFNFSETIAKDKWLIIILDHTLLIKNQMGERERETLARLQYMFMEMKKYNRNTIIQLSQMNREIETVDRINNISMHFPMRRDIFGSESIFQASDYLIVLHRPEMLNIEVYGPGSWPVTNLIYMHFLKNREGGLKILCFENNLKYNRIDEYNTSKFKQKTLTLGLW